MSVSDGLGAFFAFMMSFFIICSLIGLIIYVLGAVWEMQYLQRVGYDKSWLAWIPFGNFYAMADSAFDKDCVEAELYIFKKPCPIWVFKWFTLLLLGINLVLGWIPFVSAFTWLVDLLVYFACYVPIMKEIAKRLGVEVSDGRCILDSFITLISFYDVWAWSNNLEYIENNETEDTLVGSEE